MNKKIIAVIIVFFIVITVLVSSQFFPTFNNNMDELIDQIILEIYEKHSIENYLVWSDGKLTDNDFKKPVPDNMKDTTIEAESGVGFAVPRIMSEIINDELCQYAIVEIEISALFHRDESWMKKEGNNEYTEYVLNHEQRHFDITEIHARIFKERLDNIFLNKNFSCPQVVPKLLKNAILDEIYESYSIFLLSGKVVPQKYTHEDYLLSIYYDTTLLEIKTQKQYEDEAGKSYQTKGQEKWNGIIDDCLYKDWEKIENCPVFN